MNGAAVIRGQVNEDGTFSVLARVCSLDGTGEEYADGEGPVLKAADVSTVTCKVFDLGTDETTAAGTEVTPAPTVTVATSVLDTLRTAGWGEDRAGYNFRHDLAPAYAADPGEFRLVEYKFTLTGGGVFFVKALVRTRPVQTS